MGYTEGQANCIATLIAGTKALGQPFVFCFDNNQATPVVHWSSYTRVARIPRSQCVDVLQEVYQNRSSVNPSVKFYYSPGNQTATEMCHGMFEFLDVAPKVAVILNVSPHSFQPWLNKFPVQQAAARTAGLDAFQQFAKGPSPNVDIRTDDPGVHTIHRLYMMAAFALTELRGNQNGGNGHNIGALLVSPDGVVLGWGLNTRISNYTFHAEVNAIQSYCTKSGSPIPDGSRLYTTLKPCKMCAGMIRACTASDGQIKVYYGQDDPGEHARHTALDTLTGMLTRLGEGGSKPLKTYDTSSYQTAVVVSQDLGETLKSHRSSAIKKGGFAVTEFLQGQAALDDMSAARVALARKADKYSNLQQGNANVRQVLRHLAPLLVNSGLSEWGGVQV